MANTDGANDQGFLGQPLPPAPGQYGSDPAHTTAKGYPFDPTTGLELRGGTWRAPNLDRTEPYIPSRTDRPHSQWGEPDFAYSGAQNYPGMSPGPFMPQMSDLPNLIHGITMGLGRWGSRYSGMPAIAMGTYATAFLNAYNKGMKERAAENWQKYRQAQSMMIDRQTDELSAYRDVYNEYHDDKGNLTDPEAFQQAILALAEGRFHDAPVANAIHSGNLAMVDRILQGRDGHLLDARKQVLQEERQKEQDEERRRAAETLEEERRQRLKDAQERERERQQWQPGAATGAPGGPVTTGAGASVTTGTSAATPSTPADTTGTEPKAPTKSYALPPPPPGDAAAARIDQAARERFMDRTLHIPPAGEPFVLDRQGMYERAFDAIEADPTLNDRASIVAATKAVLPEMGQQLEAYLDGRMNMTGRDTTRGHWARIERLADKTGTILNDADEAEAERKADYLEPPYSQSQMNAPGQRGFRARAIIARADQIAKARGEKGYDQKKYITEQRAAIAFDAGQPAMQIDAINTAVSHLATLDAYADALNNGLPQTIQAAANRFLTEFGYSPPNNFDTARNVVANEVVRAIVATGGGVTDRQEARETIFSAQTPNQIKDATNSYRSLLSGRLEPLIKRWETTTGRSRDEFLQRLTPETRDALLGQAGKAIPPKASIWDKPAWLGPPDLPGLGGGTLGGSIFPPSSITPTKPGTVEPQ